MIIIVDDEVLGLERAKEAVSENRPGFEIKTFLKAREALEYAGKYPVECAFLDISMPVIDGITLAKEIKLLQPECNIVFTTGFDEHYGKAFALGASDYLLKPITAKKVERAFQNLRNPIDVKSEGIFFQCYGDFEAFCDGVPIGFKRSKTKELLAFLVLKHGAAVTKDEIMSNLWDGENSSYYGVIKKDLIDAFERLGFDHIIINSWKSLALDISSVNCDYYDFLDGKPSGLNSYMGEFMNQYDWARITNVMLLDTKLPSSPPPSSI